MSKKKPLYWVYINIPVNVAFNGRKWAKIATVVCYVPNTDHKSACTYNFAANDKSKRLYPNPLHPLVDYMIKPQKKTH